MYRQKKESLLCRFLQETNVILQRIEDDKIEQLATPFQVRQDIIEEINLLDQSVSEQIVESTQKQLNPLLRELIRLEEMIQQRLTTQKKHVSSEIRKLNQAKQAARFYHSNPYNKDGYFIDKMIKPK
jgi:hypothetical protein